MALTRHETLDQLLVEGNWHDYVFSHRRSAHLDALHYLIETLGEMSELWPVVAEIWRDSRSISAHMGHWRDIWLDECASKHLVMSERERRVLARLPEEITIYRGVGREGAAVGLSWTLTKRKAVWFANRSSQPTAFLATGTVKKHDVLALFLTRREREIVALPECVTFTVEQIAKTGLV